MSGSTHPSANHHQHPLNTLKTSESNSLNAHALSPSDELASPIHNVDSASSDHLTWTDSPPDSPIPSNLDNAHPTRQPSLSPTETHARPFSVSSTTKPRTQPLNGNVARSGSKAVGLQAEHVYRTQLSAWRFKIRSVLLAALDREMPVLERVQRCYRSGPLDRLMIHSSWLGSHQFFIVTLPLIFWLGDHRFGRSQVYILAMSVYFTGILKDLFCIPRPYSPPIERLSISNHASEYGFPSSHSATSASTFLMGFQYALNVQSPLHQLGLILGLLLYGFLLVFGRLYCGMHSIQDVVCGWMIGVVAWTLYQVFGEVVEGWVTSTEGWVAVILIITGLVLTAAHPQPVEDCPCFEDSTAFVGVFVGVMIGHRIAKDLLLQRQLEDSGISGLRFPQGLMKVVLGLMVIFGWRFLMKEILSRLLPPLFKLFAPLLELPRKHYAPTRDYGRYRDELRERGRWTGFRARLIPSVVDLPNMSHSPIRNRFFSSDTSPAECQATQTLHPALHNRTPNALHQDPLLITSQKLHSSDCKQPLWKHYDVDVLMRLIVYTGIGMLSSGILPILFDRIGLNS